MDAGAVENIFLDTKYMHDLFFLCAHDFKHDFVEDKERSGSAFGMHGYDRELPRRGVRRLLMKKRDHQIK